MSDALRRLYNQVDQLFDRRAITKEMRYTRPGGAGKAPITAWQAYQVIRPLAQELDRQARLKMIVSQECAQTDGRSAHWELFFDLTRRRAKVVCEWALPWDEAMDTYQTAQIAIAVTPFPPENSPIRQAVRDGKLLHQQMAGMWRQECRRQPDLPTPFHDSDLAMADFLAQGLDPGQNEFSLSTGKTPQGALGWMAQTRHRTYTCAFN